MIPPETYRAILERHGVPPLHAEALVPALADAVAEAVTAEMPERLDLGRPEAIARYLQLMHPPLPDQEVMGAVYLTGQHGLIAAEELFRGGLARCIAEPRPILRRGLELAAAGVVLWHTHPSGTVAPSGEDLRITGRIGAACRLLGLELLDHLILGRGGRWRSMRQTGELAAAEVEYRQ